MCTYARISLARSPSSDRTSFTRRVPPSVPPPAFRTGPSFPLVPTRDVHSRRSHDPAISLPTVLTHPRYPASSHGVPPLVARVFFSLSSFFSSTRPRAGE